MIIEELKQRITAKARKLKPYKTRVTRYRQNKQNKLFCCNQKELYEELGGRSRETRDPPRTDDARKIWNELWNTPVQYKEDDEWLLKVEKELEVVKTKNNVVITKEDVIKQVHKMPKGKSPGLDYI